MGIVQGGYTVYGEKIGIVMLDTTFPRIPGDIGHAGTFSFPVRYEVVRGATVHRVVTEGDPALVAPFVQAVQRLEKQGIQAVTTSCGFLAAFQDRIEREIDIPFYSSSLMQIPFVYSLMGRKGKVGVLTASRSSLGKKHFESLGIKNIPIAVEGMDDSPHFTRCFIEGAEQMDPAVIQEEMAEKARSLANRHEDVAAIVLECTNMPPYKTRVQQEAGLPVFDIVTLTEYVYASLP